MNGWQVLKIALDYYWAFMKANQFLGVTLTIVCVHQFVTLIRGRQTVVQAGPSPPASSSREDEAEALERPQRVEREGAERQAQPEAPAPSRYDVLLRNDTKDD